MVLTVMMWACRTLEPSLAQRGGVVKERELDRWERG